MNVRPLTEHEGRGIASWRYPGPYATYDITEPVTAEDGYWAVEHNGRLVGFCCFGYEARVPGVDEESGTLDVGYGMHPDLVGRGTGGVFVAAILNFATTMWSPDRIRMSILEWNARSRAVAAALGFDEQRIVANESTVFIVMSRTGTPS